jgi:hypothetical protein
MFYKRLLWIGVSLILSLCIFLESCSSVNPPETGREIMTPVGKGEPVSVDPTLTPAESPTDTPDAAQSSQEYTNQDFGFSLYYPNGYEVQSTYHHSITFLAPQGTQGHRERAFMQVELAGDQTAEWYASRVKEENANLGTTITSSTMDIDSQPAQILGRLPGQNLNRQVFIIYKGILYHLTFMPDDPQAGEDYQQMETLYAAIVNSLHFLPDRKDVPPVTDMNNMIYQLEKALETRSADDVLRTLGDEFIVEYWMPETPEGVIYERYDRNGAARLMIDKYVSQAPDLVFQKQVDWSSLIGSPEPFTVFFPNENVRPVLVHGWGPQGSDEAVIIIAQRRDGSLFWRGVFVAHGPFTK